MICVSAETIDYWSVDYGKTYHLRVINAALNDELFFAIAGHNLTVVGMDGTYLKPFITNYIMISPGNTMDMLITTNQSIHHSYYMATRQYSTEDQILTYEVGTAILQYNNGGNPHFSSSPIFPTENLPSNKDYAAALNYTSQLRSLASKEYPISVPIQVTTRMYIVVAMNKMACPELVNCSSSNDYVSAASMNNISWWTSTSTNILQAYYR